MPVARKVWQPIAVSIPALRERLQIGQGNLRQGFRNVCPEPLRVGAVGALRVRRTVVQPDLDERIVHRGLFPAPLSPPAGAPPDPQPKMASTATLGPPNSGSGISWLDT